jgi:P27 family predicted phage terminase small subunit
MPGPAPKPSALKLIDGNPGKRKLPANEPEPAYLNDLTPPAHLSEAGAAVWSEIAPRLRAAMLLTEIDTLSLEWLCEAAAQHRRATAEIGDKLIARNAETGSLSPSPWLIVQSMAFKRAKVLCDSFGMNPAARSRVVVNPQAGLFPPTPDANPNNPGRFFGS